MSGDSEFSDVVQAALRNIRQRLDADSLGGLLEDLRAAEIRLGADPLQLVFFSDGSGHVMALEMDPDQVRVAAVSSWPTDLKAFEEVSEFQNIDQLRTWLREGVLPEQAVDQEGATLA